MTPQQASEVSNQNTANAQKYKQPPRSKVRGILSIKKTLVFSGNILFNKTPISNSFARLIISITKQLAIKIK